MQQHDKLKLFILVRSDLTPEQKAVQAVHAQSELMRKHYPQNKKLSQWANHDKTLILLGVANERALLRWQQKLKDARVVCESFQEEAMPEFGYRDGESTALAVCPGGVDCDFFRRLKLLEM